MSVRQLIFILFSVPVVLFASQADSKEQDLELFEFLATYDQEDNIYIDSEIDESQTHGQQSETISTVTKSKSNE